MSTYLNSCIPAVDLKTAISAAVACAKAGVTPMFWGEPGVGKTAVLGPAVRDALSLPGGVYTVEVGQGDESELFALTIVSKDGTIQRLPLEQALTRLIETGGVLLLDECNRAPERMGLLLPLVQGRMWGDRMLHPDTAIIMLGNPPERGGAAPLISALANRVLHFRLAPTPDESIEYLSNLGAPDSALRRLAEDVMMVVDSRRTTLLQMAPPESAEQDGTTWANPRAYEKALRAAAECDTPELMSLMFAAALGNDVANALFAIRRLRSKLPSVSEVTGNPDTCPVPAEPDLQVAMLSLLPECFRADVNKTWAYAKRLPPEIRAVIRRRLVSKFAPTTPAGRKDMAQTISI